MSSESKKYISKLNKDALSVLNGLGYEPIYETNHGENKICGIAALKDDEGKLHYRVAHEQPECENLYVCNINRDADIYKGKNGERITIDEHGSIEIEFESGYKVKVSNFRAPYGHVNIMYKNNNGEETTLWFESGSRKRSLYNCISLSEFPNDNLIMNMFSKWPKDEQSLLNFFVYGCDEIKEYPFDKCNSETLMSSLIEKMKKYNDGAYYNENFLAALCVIEPLFDSFITNFKAQWAEWLLKLRKEKLDDPEYAAALMEAAKTLLNDSDTRDIARKIYLKKER